MITSIIHALFFIKIQPNMSEQEKKQHDLLNVETKPKFLCLPYTKQRTFFTEKELLKEKGKKRIEQKNKMKAF